MKKIQQEIDLTTFDLTSFFDESRIRFSKAGIFTEKKVKNFLLRPVWEQNVDFEAKVKGEINDARVLISIKKIGRRKNMKAIVRMSYDITGDSGFSFKWALLSLIMPPLALVFFYKWAKGNKDVEFEKSIRAAFTESLNSASAIKETKTAT